MLLHDSSYFNRNTSLPPPHEVRQRSVRIYGEDVDTFRPPPVRFEDLGLLVKYGSEITIAEAQCLWYFNRFMKDQVPTPELFGWCVDDDQTFIYMQLVPGDTLEERWPSLNAGERTSICEQLRECVEAWRGLRQETEPYIVSM
jgi:hypothetical protein